MNNLREVNDDILKDWLMFREEDLSSLTCEEDKKHYCRAGRYELADRKGERFPLVLDDSTCRCTVMSFRKADHTHRINELKSAGINCFRINIFDEDTDEIMDILKYVR